MNERHHKVDGAKWPNGKRVPLDYTEHHLFDFVLLIIDAVLFLVRIYRQIAVRCNRRSVFWSKRNDSSGIGSEQRLHPCRSKREQTVEEESYKAAN
ncbi:hypothetical protein BLOT_000342 [Blomia tropicalis]|nr:hypothetical protein BLOT_000342 [Blomia tropicalis]